MTQLTVVPSSPAVPQGYAEKAMASLLQLHDELMHEKEKRIELVRALMEKEQALAELRQTVRLLEERARATEQTRGPSAAQPPESVVMPADSPPPPAAAPTRVPPKAPGVASPRRDAWRVW